MAAQDSLKVATILGRTASGASTGVADVDQEELRLATTALLGPGYLPSMIDQTANTSAFNVRQDTGSNMQLKIGSGTSKKDGYVLLGTVAGQGAYIVRLDATTKTITVPATDATNPARYGVYLFIDDAAYSGTASRAYAQVACIRGTPAGSPTTPGPLSTYSAYVLLWEFQLAANATAVTNTILDAGTDQRKAAGLIKGAGGVVAAPVSLNNQTGIASVTDLTGMTFTFPAYSTRRYRADVYVTNLSQQTANGTVILSITNASNTTLAQVSQDCTTLTANGPLALTYHFVGTNASTTLKARMSTSAGTVNIGSGINSTTKCWMSVEDIGPA